MNADSIVLTYVNVLPGGENPENISYYVSLKSTTYMFSLKTFKNFDYIEIARHITITGKSYEKAN